MSKTPPPFSVFENGGGREGAGLQMLALHKAKAAARTQSVQDVAARQVRAVDEQIDRLVYQLYGLTEEEVKIVKEAV